MEKVSHVGKKIARGLAGKVKSKQELKDDEVMSADQYNAYTNFYNQYSEEDNKALQKVESLGALTNNDQNVNWIEELIQYSVKFTAELVKIRALFATTDERGIAEVCLEVANGALDELSDMVKNVLHQHPAINGTDILAASCNLITQIKGFPAEEKEVSQCVEDILFSVDQLALAFTDSVSEYVRDQQEFSVNTSLRRVQSSESLAMDNHQPRSADVPVFGNAKADEVLHQAVHGVDVALNRAKLWTKYTKDIIVYIDKRTSLLCEFAKKLSQLAGASKPLLMEESHLSFQSIFCMAMDQDMDYSASCQAAAAEIIQLQIINRLSDRRAEHDRVRRLLRDEWAREQKKLEDAVLNLKKTKALYIQRQTEYERLKDNNVKMDSEGSQQSLVSTSKIDKKRKVEDDAFFKAVEAENAYRVAVLEAKQRKEAVDKVKAELVSKIRKLLEESDRILQKVVTEYFHVLHGLSVAQPVQMSTLAESCQHSEPAAQYLAYIRSLSQSLIVINKSPSSLTFEPYAADRQLASGSNVARTPMTGCEDVNSADSPILFVHKSLMLRRDGHVGSVEDEGESGSVTSWQSISSTPSGSPQQSRRQLRSDYVDADIEIGFDVLEDMPLQCSPFANNVVLTHNFQRSIVPTTCKLCGNLVIRGVCCSKCGLSVHKKCLDVLKFECGGKNIDDRGVSSVASISFLVQRCIEEIDKRGMELKGIYRTSGAKLKVEELIKSFAQGRVAEEIDLGEHHPNVIASVLKQSLRELPEPLLTFQLYPAIMKLAKSEKGIGGEKKSEQAIVAELRQLLRSSLVTISWRLCKLLHYHLKRVSDKVEVNQMSASNLGIVFGPTLLRSSDVTPTAESLLDTQYQARAIELMIKHCEDVFGNENDLGDRSNEPRLSDNTWDVPEITVNLLDELALEEPHFQKLTDDHVLPAISTQTVQPTTTQSTAESQLITNEGESSLSMVTDVLNIMDAVLGGRKSPLVGLYSAPASMQSLRQTDMQPDRLLVHGTTYQQVLGEQWSVTQNPSSVLVYETEGRCNSSDDTCLLSLHPLYNPILTATNAAVVPDPEQVVLPEPPSSHHLNALVRRPAFYHEHQAYSVSNTEKQHTQSMLGHNEDRIKCQLPAVANRMPANQNQPCCVSSKVSLSSDCVSLLSDSEVPSIACVSSQFFGLTGVQLAAHDSTVSDNSAGGRLTSGTAEDSVPRRKISRSIIKRSHNDDPLKYRAEDITPRYRHTPDVTPMHLRDNESASIDVGDESDNRPLYRSMSSNDKYEAFSSHCDEKSSTL